MAKQKEESAGGSGDVPLGLAVTGTNTHPPGPQEGGSEDVPLGLAVIAGSLAATIAQNGVMKGAHDLMLGLQAIRVYEAIKRVQGLAEIDPEMIHEPVTDDAIRRMYAAITEQAARIKAEAEEASEKAAAAEAAKAKAARQSEKDNGDSKKIEPGKPTDGK